MKTKLVAFLLMVGWFPLIFGCVGGTRGGTGGTETGTTSPIDTSNLAARLEAVADSLVPEVSDSSSSSLQTLQALTLGTSDQWDQYLQENNLTVLTDVFGPGDEHGVVTRIRVLVNQFRATIEDLFSQDPEISCDGANLLEEGDELEIAFLPNLSNGTAEDRWFDCVFTQPQEDPEDHYTTLYGRDANGTIRIVHMFDVTNENQWWPAERGNLLRNLQVVSATYSETEEEGTTVGYLDLQYAQASLYSGLDDDLEAEDDNVLFKSRTRITGRATLDESGTPTAGVGDFTVTKYDRGINEDGTVWSFVTKSIGRGDYSSSGYSLFGIDSDGSSLAGAAGTFCIQMPVDGSGLPAYAAAENCSSFETAYAWGSATFPSTPTPEVDLNFEDKDFFGEDDLIGNSGDNFTIPSYDSSTPPSDETTPSE